jgi:hypothetical protein
MPEHFDHKMLWTNRAMFESSDRLLVLLGHKQNKIV